MFKSLLLTKLINFLYSLTSLLDKDSIERLIKCKLKDSRYSQLDKARKHIFSNLYIRKESINEVKEDIIECLDFADSLGYEVIFRTPECVAYKNCHLHVARTKEGKEVIMIDLIY